MRWFMLAVAVPLLAMNGGAGASVIIAVHSDKCLEASMELAPRIFQNSLSKRAHAAAVDGPVGGGQQVENRLRERLYVYGCGRRLGWRHRHGHTVSLHHRRQSEVHSGSPDWRLGRRTLSHQNASRRNAWISTAATISNERRLDPVCWHRPVQSEIPTSSEMMAARHARYVLATCECSVSPADLLPRCTCPGIAHLGLLALRPAQPLHVRRDHRSDRWFRRPAYRRPANHRLVDAVIAHRLHLSVDALAGAGRVGGAAADQQQCECE